MAKSENKTKPTEVTVETFLAGVTPPKRVEDARAVMSLMSEITGDPPVMWGPSIIGFGAFHYRYDSGREGDMPIVGFAPRKPALVLYIHGDFPNRADLVAALGVKGAEPRGCIHVKKLEDADPKALRALISASVKHLRAKAEA